MKPPPIDRKKGKKLNSQEQSALKWGGLAGMLGGVLLLAVFAFLAAFVGLETLDAEAAVERFPEVRWARIIENTAYLFAIALWALHSVALVVALRATSYGPALAGCVISVLGLAVLATGAIPHTATTVISDLYHAPETSADIKPVLILAWHVGQGWVDMFVVTGVVLTPIGMLLYALAMRPVAGFGRWIPWVALALGVAGLCAAGASLIEEGDIVGVGVFALVFFHAIVGWRTFRLATA